MLLRLRPFVRRRRQPWNTLAIRRWCATNASPDKEVETKEEEAVLHAPADRWGSWGAPPPAEDAQLSVADYIEKHKHDDGAYGLNPPDWDKMHPRDTPVWAAPEAGGSEKGKELVEEHYTPGMGLGGPSVRPSQLERGLTTDYKQHGREDSDQMVRFNDPEWFLPEEPKLLEFWGLAPFLFFAGAAVLSKEWALLDEELSEFTWVLTFGFGFWSMMRINANRSNIYEQFMMDRSWQSLEHVSDSLNNMIGEREDEVKSVERGQQFDAYVQALNDKKSSYYAYIHNRDFNERILQKLRVVATAEKNFQRSLMEDLISTVARRVETKISSAQSMRNDYRAAALRLFEESTSSSEFPDLGSLVDPIQPIYEEVITAYLTELEASADKTQAQKSTTKRLATTLLHNLSDLSVYDGQIDAPDESSLRSTGFFGQMTPEQRAAVPTASHLKERMRTVIEEQIDRFQPEKVPAPLLERRATHA